MKLGVCEHFALLRGEFSGLSLDVSVSPVCCSCVSLQ